MYKQECNESVYLNDMDIKDACSLTCGTCQSTYYKCFHKFRVAKFLMLRKAFGVYKKCIMFK
jgi:hypothetical protein